MKYYKRFDSVDNNIKLRKSKFSPYYTTECNLSFDYNNFESGSLQLIKQHVQDESLVGKKIIIYYLNFDVKTGDVVYIEPKVMEYRWITLFSGRYINLVSVEDSRTQSCNYWDSIKAFVWDYDKQDKALVEYNNKVTEMMKLREEVMNKKTAKELKGLSKIISTKVK